MRKSGVFIAFFALKRFRIFLKEATQNIVKFFFALYANIHFAVILSDFRNEFKVKCILKSILCIFLVQDRHYFARFFV